MKPIEPIDFLTSLQAQFAEMYRLAALMPEAERVLTEIAACRIAGCMLRGNESFQQIETMLTDFNQELQSRVTKARALLAKIQGA